MKIAQGFVDFDSGNNPTMMNPTDVGDRVYTETISLDGPGNKVPAVAVAVRLMDHISSTNLRYEVTAEAITATSCEIRLRTWDNTRLAKVRVAWSAAFV